MISSDFVKREVYDAHFDLHGGGFHERLSTFVFAPKDGTEEAQKVSMDLAKFMNVEYVVMTEGGLTHYAVEQGIPCL